MSILLPLRALLPYVIAALPYLLRQVLPPAPSTISISIPSVLPFNGGQCPVSYYPIFTMQYSNGTTQIYNQVVEAGQRVSGPLPALAGVVEIGTLDVPSGLTSIRTAIWANYLAVYGGGSRSSPPYPVSGRVAWFRVDGGTDDCGSLPNSNPPIAPSTSGLADSANPNLDDSEIVQAAIPALAIPSFASALLAALQAAKSASDALAGIRAIADAIESMVNLLNGLKDNVDKDNKEKDKNNKEISRYDFGSIRYDGYLRIYPSTGSNEREAAYIDLQLLSIPVHYGKYFGKQSPNFYRFKSLGYISFVSPSFGTIETIEIKFSRMSLNVPANASGFFYHLGLEGDIIANVSAFYVKAKQL